MAIPASFLGAVAAKFDDAVTGVPGGIWVDQAAEPLQLPLVEFTWAAEREYQFDKAYVDTGTVLMLVWAKGADAAEAVGAKLTDAFETEPEDMEIDNPDGQKVVTLYLGSYKVAAERGVRAEDGAQVYRLELGFHAELSGLRP